MADYLPRRQPQTQLPIPLEILAENAVIDAVSAATQQNRLRNPREGRVEEFNAASEFNDREARLISIDVLAEIDGDLEEVGYVYFDHFFLANLRNTAMHAAYATGRADYPDDLNAALERAWEIRRREWAVAAAIPGHRQDHDDGDVVLHAIAHAPSERSPSIMKSTNSRAPRPLLVKAMAKIVAVMRRLRH